ncbi:hypothetical protein [Puerhibacterium puerhi]|uniref:hypothetical protein n=1 Tax=Puerhibacterium puerhi TaxID=2692623 RepID=UPI001358F2C4|nr:hypothetical protein [Puerhibacterium puerhi]
MTAATPSRPATPPVPSPAAAPRRSVGRRIGTGLAAALLAGLAGGLAARVLMRLANLVVGGETGFSVPGTAIIVVLFVLCAIPGALTVALGARRTGAVLLGLGAAFLAYQCVLVGVQDLGSHHLSGPQTAAVVAIALGFAAAVVGEALLAWRWATRAARR